MNNDGKSSDLPLVHKPAGAVEKAAPGAKIILSGMAADALALWKKQSTQRALSIAICGEHGGLDHYLVAWLQHESIVNCVIRPSCFAFSEDLLNTVDPQSFDLFFIFLNPELPSKTGKADVHKFIADLKAKFHRPIIVISNEWKYSQWESSSFMEAGADAFWPMPFGSGHIKQALISCGIISSHNQLNQ